MATVWAMAAGSTHAANAQASCFCNDFEMSDRGTFVLAVNPA
jgi:hypothetical protein